MLLHTHTHTCKFAYTKTYPYLHTFNYAYIHICICAYIHTRGEKKCDTKVSKSMVKFGGSFVGDSRSVLAWMARRASRMFAAECESPCVVAVRMCICMYAYVYVCKECADGLSVSFVINDDIQSWMSCVIMFSLMSCVEKLICGVMIYNYVCVKIYTILFC
jgi:hypothetical protein